MIRLYNSTETIFEHRKSVLANAISCFVEEEEGGMFSATFEIPSDERIQEDKIIVADTPRGEQAFRIKKITKKLSRGKKVYQVYARHIFYDLLGNYLINIRPTNVTQNNALQSILNGAEIAHNFTGTSNVPGLNTANYVRMNLVQALIGQNENSLLSRWGGFLIRDNFSLNFQASSFDRGYEVRFGKNLVGIEEDIDLTEVVTRVYPTVVIKDNIVTELPEKYIDSPIMGSYPSPIISELRIDLSDEEKELPIESIYSLMRNRAADYFGAIDYPRVNYKVDFVELSKTEQYKHLAILETLDISDTVTIKVEPFGIDVKSRLIKYKYDSLRSRFVSMELGNFKPKLTNTKLEVVKTIEKLNQNLVDGEIASRLKAAIDLIIGHKGGYKIELFDEFGVPTGTAYMDTKDVNTAQNYILINNQGIAFGDSGLSNPPTVAIDIHGNIVAGTGFFNSLVTNLIQSDIGQSLDLSSNESISLRVSSEVTTKLSDPAIQEQFKGDPGIQGPPGADGQSQWTHLRYSANANGSSFVNTPNATTKYIGIAVTTSSTAPTTAGAYTWQKFVGEDGAQGSQGIQGPPGTDGQPTYTWIRYADTPTTGMSDNPSGKKYIGIAHNKTTATESSVYADYTWSLIQGPKGDKGDTGAIGPQGIQGPAGADGQPTYTWLKYADTPTTGMSDSPTGKKYMGLAVNKLTPTESTTYADYTWSLIEGPQGSQGPAGADGQPTYTWVKYADTITGTGMSDSPTGKRFVGMAFNKTTPTKSTTPGDYAWSPLYDNVKVGGRNLILDSANIAVDNLNSTPGSNMEYSYISVDQSYMNVPSETEVTLSFDLEMQVNTANPSLLIYNTNRKGPKQITNRTINWIRPAGSLIKERVFVNTIITDRADATLSDNHIEFYSTYGTSNWFKIENLKLEKGNVATDWTPAPEDVQSQIDEQIIITNNQQTTIDALLGEIVLKVSETVMQSSLDQVTQDIISQFTTELTQTSETWEFLRTKLQTDLENQIGSNSTSISELHEWVRIEGAKLILGRSNSEFVLNVRNDRIYFEQAGTEVAYFSNSKLYIYDVEAINSLTIGNFKWVPRANGNLSLI